MQKRCTRGCLASVVVLVCSIAASSFASEVKVVVGSKPTGDVNRMVFGGHYYDIRDQKDAYKQMGMTVCREGGPGFESPGSINPEPDKWVWGNFDHWLNWLGENNITGLALLGGAPGWTMKGGDKTPADWQYFYDKWSTTAAAIVRHANANKKANLQYWEIWNEPDGPHWFNQGWNVGWKEYAELFKMTAKKIKAVDKNAKVGTGGIAAPFTGGLENWWVKVVTVPGVAKLVDFVCVHGYYGDPANGIFANGIDRTRALMRKHLGKEVPIWITEFNANMYEDFTKRGIPQSLEGLYVAEYLALFVHKKVDAAMYFCVGWWESDFCPWNSDGTPRPSFKAYEWWKDYQGKTLPATVMGIKGAYAIASEDENRKVLYMPVSKQGKYEFVFQGSKDYTVKTVSGFYGGEVRDVKYTEALVNENSKTVTFEWPKDSRALVKIILAK